MTDVECLPEEVLHVVAVVSNPRRYKRRYELFENFVKHILLSPHVKLHVVECAFGARAFHFDGKLPAEVDYIKVRTETELWLKENLINIGVSKLPMNWKYLAWIDGDIEFVNPNWARETIHMLHHHPIVQMFSHVIDLGPKYEVLTNYINEMQTMVDISFAYKFAKCELSDGDSAMEYGAFGQPGFAWACTRDAWDLMGGLIDKSICGAGDHQQAWALVGKAVRGVHGGMPQIYKDYINTWEKHCVPIHNQLGYVPGTILHYFHGARKKRKYRERWKILVDAKYNPYTDVKYDAQGVLQLAKPNSKLMRDLQFYFTQRDEDNSSVD